MLRDPKDRLIVALDVDSIDRAVGLVDALAGQVTRFKIGSQLYTAAGPAAVEHLGAASPGPGRSACRDGNAGRAEAH